MSNPFYNEEKKAKDDSEKEVEEDSNNASSDEKKKKKKSSNKQSKTSKSKKSEKKPKKEKKAKKDSSSYEDSTEEDSSDHKKEKKGKSSKKHVQEEKRVITDEDRAAIISPLVDDDKKVVKKALTLLSSYKSGELNEKKLIGKLIKLCGVDTAKMIVSEISLLFVEPKIVMNLSKVRDDFNWPSLISSIEDQLKEEKYEDKDDETTVSKKLVDDYYDVRKNGVKLRKKLLAMMKRMDKKTTDYQKLRELKKTMESLQEECDRCVDEEELDVEELGEMILLYSESVNNIFSVLSGPIDVKDSSDSESEDDSKKKKKIRIPKFDDDDDDDDDDDERQKINISNRKAVYKAVIKEANGKLSMSHITLEPRAQAGVPLDVKQDEVIGFCWKEKTGSRMLFRSILSTNNNESDSIEIVPLKVRISDYHMIFRAPATGVLRLGWDNDLSLRKAKEIDVFVKRFTQESGDEVMNAEMKRQEQWRQVEKSDLAEGNIEGGRLTLKLTAREMTGDGVKYTCHCDWENRSLSIKTQWDVQYPYLVWLEWYQTIKAKYPSRVNQMAVFSGTAFMTTKAVVEDRLLKINNFFQDLVLDHFIMETPEVVSWFRCQENIRRAKKEYYDQYKIDRERKQREEEEIEKKKKEIEVVKVISVSEEELFDPLSYLCG